ncbi:hypothetical protein IU459_23275 [Nocardia amamiensis]|uniref:DUF2637 domain-containing protein n=1 Tax=Nocardia amamiensis TaxID=404578 RepID=A0ABS0CV06_9NOCA|nr:hypothetical protein [Nocardia amamiensis]MBF6300444.1 hypothetical protein [Nocardia amamiensis]
MTNSLHTPVPTSEESPRQPGEFMVESGRWWSRRSGRMVATDLAQRVALAEKQLPWQGHSALYDVHSEREIAAERRLHVWMRAKQRRQRKRVFRAELADAARDRRTSAAIEREDAAEQRWHRRARAQRRRETNPDALEGMLHRRATRSSWRLRAVMAIGLLWSAVNVGRNLTPDGASGEVSWWLLWALSFGIEAMISVPILEIMAQAATAARLGITVQRTKILLFEAVLLTSTVGLNSGPHLAAGDLGRAAEYSVAPIMVVVLMWLHAWLTARNAEMISAIAARRTETAAHESPASDASGASSAQRAIASTGRPVLSPVTPRPVYDTSATTIAAAASTSAVSAPLPRTVETAVATRDDLDAQAKSHPPAEATARADGDTMTTVVVDPCGEIAEQLVLRKLVQKPAPQIVAILQLAAQGFNANRIATEMSAITSTPWARSTVDRIIARAESLGFDPTTADQGVAA